MEKKLWSEKIKKKTSAADLKWTEKLTRDKMAQSCYKIVGRDSTGREAYYFVHIKDEAKKKAFLAHQVGDTYNIEDYGEVVYSAYGTDVPKEVREMLAEKYGFDNFGDEEDNDEEDDAIYFNSADFD